MSTSIFTPSHPYQRRMGTSSASTAFDTVIPTTSHPKDDAASDRLVVKPGNNGVEVLFFGGDANNEGYRVRIWRWKEITKGLSDSTVLWVPTLHAELDVRFGNITGVSGGLVSNTEFFADTLVVRRAMANYRIEQYADDTVALFYIDHMGAQFLDFDWELDASGFTTAAAGNALVASL